MTDTAFDKRYAEALKKFPLVQAFNDAEDEFGDHKSTEFLVSIVCDRHDVNYSDVIDQLACFSEEVGAAK